MKEMQQTIASEVKYEGLGLHSGLPVKMKLKPATANTGIVFIRTDLSGQPEIKAHITNVTNTLRATTIGIGEAKVMTVEHILSALFALQIDNCYVEMDSIEPPVADGSGVVFAEMITKAGIVELSEKRNIFRITKSYAIYDEDRFILALPYDGFRVTFTSINKHPLLGTQMGDYIIEPQTYMKEIAPARTIGFMHELESLQAMGLAKGGTVENCIVYDDEKCLSELRFEDELVRHKILDVLGDFSLLGPLHGHIVAVKSSHELNARLSREILKDM